MEPSLATILMERRKELRHDCAPMFFRLSNQEDKERMHALLQEHPNCSVVDNLHLQLRDLVKLENPSRTLTELDYSELIAQKLGVIPSDDYGVWIYFSWKDTLVHWLDEEDFIAVRTVRNKYKITQEEQDILKAKRVGVIGLSVGHAAAMSLAMERIGGEIRIADFDRLELSNMNRIRTSGLNLDLPKTVIVAREIAEIDPFIKVTCYSEGITEDNIDAFLTEGGKLDALVEECDGIDIKFLARERCRHFRIPVVMETSDRGMLDIERYDLDGEYPLFHGLVDTGVSYDFLKTLKTSEEKLPYVLPIVGSETISTRFKASLLEVGQTITTWPQLAGEVSMGGAVCSIVVRGILCGGEVASGRHWIDFQGDIFRNALDESKPMLFEASLSKEEIESISEQNSEVAEQCLTEKELSEILGLAVLAPSPGNNQKWKFHFYRNQLFIYIDKKTPFCLGDNMNIASTIAIGCVLENIDIASKSIGLIGNFVPSENPDIVSFIGKYRFSRGADLGTVEYNKRLRSLARIRCTTRRNVSSRGLKSNEISSLICKFPSESKYSSIVITDPEVIYKIGVLNARCERIRLLNARGHSEFFKQEVRWNAGESHAHGDGLDLTLFDFKKSDFSGLQLAQDERAIDFLRNCNLGRGFEKVSIDGYKKLAGLGVVFSPSFQRDDLILLGRKIQEMWLTATDIEAGIHPVTAIPMMTSYAHSDVNHFLSDEEKTELASILEEFNLLVGSNEGHVVFIFRIMFGEILHNLSSRKPLSEKLVVT